MQSGLTEDEEVALVLLAQAGDVHAFDRLAKEYRRPVILIARKIVLCEHLAEDVAQDALVTAYKALPGLKQPERFAGWLGAIVRNRALRVATKGVIREEPLEAHLDSLIMRAAPSIVEGDHDFDAEGALDLLPEETREIARLYYLKEWPVSRIGELLSLPVTTVKWRLHVARQHLRKQQGAFHEQK